MLKSNSCTLALPLHLETFIYHRRAQLHHVHYQGSEITQPKNVLPEAITHSKKAFITWLVCKMCVSLLAFKVNYLLLLLDAS